MKWRGPEGSCKATRENRAEMHPNRGPVVPRLGPCSNSAQTETAV